MRILLAVAVAVICGGVFAVTQAQQSADARSYSDYEAAQGLRGATMRMSLNVFMAVDRGREAMRDVQGAQAELTHIFGLIDAGSPGRAPQRQQMLAEQAAAAQELGRIAQEAASGRRGMDLKHLQGQALGRFLHSNDALLADLRKERAATVTNAARRPVLLVVVLCLIFGVLHLFLVEKPAFQERRRRAQERAESERDLHEAKQRASTDALTGLANKRTLQDAIARAAAHAGRSLTPLSLIVFDLDHFKSINDTYGHDQGDLVLAAVGAVAARNVRASDVVGRFGGEEFALVLPDTGRDGAVALAEKLRTAIGGISIPGIDRRISASFGVAVIPDDAGEPDALFREADQALYAAKRAGRDRVETASRVARQTLHSSPVA
jgi:diguanylate cyclase (GGDEF)-like protein